MGETLFGQFYGLNKALFAQGGFPDKKDRMVTTREKRRLFERAKEKNWLVKKALEGNSGFVNIYDSLKMSSLARPLMPALKSEEIERSRELLAEIIPNTEHLKRRGILFPDNMLTGAAYGAIIGAGYALLGDESLYSSLLGAGLGGILGTLGSLDMRNRSFLDFESHQNILAPRPWDALQLLDLEREYYRNNDDNRWAYMDINEVNITDRMTKSQRRNFAGNKLVLNEGIVQYYKNTQRERENPLAA